MSYYNFRYEPFNTDNNWLAITSVILSSKQLYIIMLYVFTG